MHWHAQKNSGYDTWILRTIQGFGSKLDLNFVLRTIRVNYCYFCQFTVSEHYSKFEKRLYIGFWEQCIPGFGPDLW